MSEAHDPPGEALAKLISLPTPEQVTKTPMPLPEPQEVFIPSDMAETNPSWPGERYPTQLDVENAHKVPEPTFLRDFKHALVARDIVRHYSHVTSWGFDTGLSRSSEATMSRNLDDENSPGQLMYPLALLSNLPTIPNSEELETLEACFWALCKNFLFLRAVFMQELFSELLPPYLRLAMACLASCFPLSAQNSVTDSNTSSPNQYNTGSNLYFAGSKVWGVMLELDNREARKTQAVIAMALLATYGTMSADPQVWLQTSVYMGYLDPIVRRLHLHDYCAQFDNTARLNKGNATKRDRSLLMSYILLVDVVRSVHSNTSIMFTSSELFITMPASGHEFHHVYTRLITDEHTLPHNITEQEDAILLLLALLSDIISIHRTFSGFNLQTVSTMASQPSMCSKLSPIINPFVPFSPLSENQRMLSQITKGLSRWEERFGATMPKDILALFYFCNLCLCFPKVLLLSQLSEYKPTKSSYGSPTESEFGTIAVPDAALNYAWSIIDHVNVEALPDRSACPIWLPIVTYSAALVIWANIKASLSTSRPYGTLKLLGLFKSELQQMPWPCCTEMAKNLDDLAQSHSASR